MPPRRRFRRRAAAFLLRALEPAGALAEARDELLLRRLAEVVAVQRQPAELAQRRRPRQGPAAVVGDAVSVEREPWLVPQAHRGDRRRAHVADGALIQE